VNIMKLKSFSNSFLGTFLFSAVLFCLIGISSFDAMAQKESDNNLQTSFEINASVTPVVNPGGDKNPTCAQLNASTDPRFAHITSNASLKLDRSSPNGTFTFTTGTQNGTSTELTGAAPQPGKTITVSSTGSTLNSFLSQLTITAVIVKGGNEGSNVYPYPSGTTTDTILRTPDIQNGISHLTFCFSTVPIGPTAAPASVSGRVRDENGKGVAFVLVTAVNLSTGESLQAQTDIRGRYRFEDLPTAEDYLVTATSRRYTFTPNNRVISLLEDLVGLDFAATQRWNWLR